MRTSSVLFLLFFFCLIAVPAYPQFPPAAGLPGSTAIYYDSSILIGWGKSCSVLRGYINIADTNELFEGSNRTSYGNEYMTSDTADNFVISLGDGGSAIMEFNNPISNGPGFDFAVFENGFGDEFLELAFVEVSSDGIHFVRFPSISLTQTSVQTSTFGTTETTKIHNLAGKYRFLYGTPFDLDDLKDSAGIDLNHIFQVKIIDVSGCLLDGFASVDALGNKINDPWPTPFDTGGFDLDAIGVMHFASQGIADIHNEFNIQVYPNPVSDWLTISSPIDIPLNLSLSDLSGRILDQYSFKKEIRINISAYSKSCYIIRFSTADGQSVFRKIFKN